MNSLNIHDANDMQSHKLGEAMFDEDDIFVGERSGNSKFSTHHQDQSMEFTSNQREGLHLHTLVDRDAEALQERG